MAAVRAFVTIGLPVATAWLLVVAFGALAVAALPRWMREDVVPATGVIGAMVLVVALHLTSLVVGVQVGVAFVIAAGLAAAGAVVTRRPRISGTAVRRFVLASAIGLLPLTLLLIPEFRLGRAEVVEPTLNNDAFAYVTLADWFTAHRALDRPDTTAGPPAYGYVASHIDVGLRVGEELLQAANAVVNGSDPSRTWYPTMAVWLALLPGSLMAAAALLGYRHGVGALAAVVVSLGAVVVGLGFNQNSASLLGVAMAPLVLALLVRTVEAGGRARGASAAPPVWFVAVAAAAFLGTYTEYAPLFGGVVLVLVVVAARRRGEATAVGRVGRVALVSVVLAPLVYFNAARSLLHDSSEGPTRSAFYTGKTPTEFANRFLGSTPLSHLGHLTPLGAVVIVGFLAGVVAALLLDRRRALWAALLGSWAALLVYLDHVSPFPYGYQRAVEITNPLLLFLSVVGWCVLVRDIREVWPAAGRRLAIAGLVVGALFLVLNVQRSVTAGSSDLVAERHVDDTLRDTAAWVAERSGPGGDGAQVVTTDFFDQLWLTYLLRHERSVAYPTLFPDYLQLHKFVPRGAHRYAAVDRSTTFDVPDGEEVGGNDRYRFLDLEGETTTTTAPSDE